jgi:RIO kinase 1
MLYQAWKGGAFVPTPARRVENMLTMRYLGDERGPSPRLHDVVLDDPRRMFSSVLQGIESLAKAGVVHSDLSPYNILLYENRPWFIDLSEAIRIDRLGYSHWQRLEVARKALEHGLTTIQEHFAKYGIETQAEGFVDRILESVDRFKVMGEK